MDPSTASIILSIIAVISSVSAHMRLHSKCHIDNVLDVSIEKQFNDDLGKVDKKSSDDETDL
jgi:hypothetical protein